MENKIHDVNKLFAVHSLSTYYLKVENYCLYQTFSRLLGMCSFQPSLVPCTGGTFEEDTPAVVEGSIDCVRGSFVGGILRGRVEGVDEGVEQSLQD